VNVLVTGAAGILGRDLVSALAAHELKALTRADADLAEPGALERAAGSFRPDLVVHAAAYTDVDGCERDPQRATRDNVVATDRTARAAAAWGVPLVAVSTDYVFSGTARTPYSVQAPTGPLSVYGRTKLAAEDAVREAGGPFLIVRTAWLVGPHGRNFVEAIRERARRGESLAVVDDQRGAPTFTFDFAPALIALALAGARGNLHLTNAGECTRYEWAREIVRQEGLATTVTPCRSEDVPRPARRPAYSVLDNADAVAILGRPLLPWQDALARYLAMRPWPKPRPGDR
jgi:dTDP-4-dehydrorhamnose reductase